MLRMRRVRWPSPVGLCCGPSLVVVTLVEVDRFGRVLLRCLRALSVERVVRGRELVGVCRGSVQPWCHDQSEAHGQQENGDWEVEFHVAAAGLDRIGHLRVSPPQASLTVHGLEH